MGEVRGDKGSKTFKMSFQIGNTPNLKNTCVFTIFEARDTTANLHIALERYISQISTLQTKFWRYTCICTGYTYMYNTSKMLEERESDCSCLGIMNFYARFMASLEQVVRSICILYT